MTFAFFLRTLLCGLALSVSIQPIAAQTAECHRYRDELAAMEQGGARRNSEAARRQRYEIGRMTGYYRSIGCEEAGSFFGGPAPAECGAIAQRLRAMEANYDRLAAGEFGEETEYGRRQQLLAAIAALCGAEREPEPRWGGRLDGSDERAPPDHDGIVQEPGRVLEEEPGSDAGLGGGRTICVRTCDGGFFPLENRSSAGADAMCQALCPGAEARAYSVPYGPTALDSAVSSSGRRYADLPNAFKYQKQADPTCACKKDGDTWAEVLARAETLLDRHPGDVVVSAQKAEELSRPRRENARSAAEAKGKKPAGRADIGTVAAPAVSPGRAPATIR